VARGNLEETAALLRLGADTDGRLGGRTALMIAAERGRRDLVDRLLAGGARVKAVTERGETALLFAVRGGHREAALALLAQGADANDKDPTTDVLGRPVPPPSPGSARAPAATAAVPNGPAGTRGPLPAPVGRSVLRIAVDNGDVALAEALLAHGAAVKTPRAGNPPILPAALAHGDSAMALTLLKGGAGLTPERDTVWTARVLPVPSGAERLLPPPVSPPGAPVVLPPGVGDPPAPDLPTVTQTAWTPLMAAAICCDARVVKALLAKGAKVATTTADGQTALSLAVAYDRSEAVRILLARGAAVNAKDAASRTPLSLAVVYGRTALVSELLAKGAAVDARDQAGRTPLLAAITAGQRAAVAVLLAHGADTNAKDAAGRTALSLAVAKGDAALVAALLDHGAAADLGEAGAALRDALGRGQAAVVQTLLDHGVPATTPRMPTRSVPPRSRARTSLWRPCSPRARTPIAAPGVTSSRPAIGILIRRAATRRPIAVRPARIGPRCAPPRTWVTSGWCASWLTMGSMLIPRVRTGSRP
jgi:ankyrin repeat protein